MPKYRQNDSRISDGVNLLISILVRYPEIGTVNYDSEQHSLKLTFLLSAKLPAEEFDRFRSVLSGSMETYHLLEGHKRCKTSIQLSECDAVSILTIERDVTTLSKGEIALVIALLRERLKDRLIVDASDALFEEDLLAQEEVIDNMLANIKEHHHSGGLIGIREEGRVLVFNK